jgi:meso-butanediol dehydrogenase/(S,S)-butanediol dehydrogenase/diacetyl reductase
MTVSLEDWETVLDVNLRGTFLVSRATLPHMLARGKGAVVNMGSVEGLAGDARMAAYNAAKAAVVNLSRSMAIGFRPRGIRTITSAPALSGPRRSNACSPAKTRARVEAVIPAGRIGRSTDIAAPAVFRVSDDADYLNGTTVAADEGLIARTGIPI